MSSEDILNIDGQLVLGIQTLWFEDMIVIKPVLLFLLMRPEGSTQTSGTRGGRRWSDEPPTLAKCSWEETAQQHV